MGLHEAAPPDQRDRSTGNRSATSCSTKQSRRDGLNWEQGGRGRPQFLSSGSQDAAACKVVLFMSQFPVSDPHHLSNGS